MLWLKTSLSFNLSKPFAPFEILLRILVRNLRTYLGIYLKIFFYMTKNLLFSIYLLIAEYGSRKILPKKIPPPRKFPPIKLPPGKSPQKTPTWNITTHFINCLSSLNTSPINGGRVYMYICIPGQKKLIAPERLRVFSRNFGSIS